MNHARTRNESRAEVRSVLATETDAAVPHRAHCRHPQPRGSRPGAAVAPSNHHWLRPGHPCGSPGTAVREMPERYSTLTDLATAQHRGSRQRAARRARTIAVATTRG